MPGLFESGFFENLSNKVNEVSDMISQKAKDVTAQQQLTRELKQFEVDRLAKFVELGKKFYEYKKNPDAAAPDFDEIIGAISKIDEEVETRRQAELDIRGVIVCENCGKELNKDVSFCPYCGTPVPVKVVTPEEKIADGICPGCGAKVTPDMRFCEQCGYKLFDEPEAEPLAEPAAEAEEAKAEE